MKCPQCGSDTTQRLQVVHEQGTQLINTTSNTVGTGFNASPLASLGLAGARTKTTGTAQSAMAQRAAPPPRYPVVAGLGVVLFGLLCLAGDGWAKLGGLALMATGLYASHWAHAYNREKWPALYARWESSWLCSKCGCIYVQELN
ncbi:hypothetical protein [Sphaerotilus microaerophilus]|uniref:Uncharacterized protein n=1 Tax=Sphaerotilus microaerophilus TaxID=2914710 RepID=A0ABN6PTB3_9BURK|nr:hypothetical protein [Sphaerotilus sp. FB-5]BDI07342.1 hypothetical protein CATMQ487_43120 [Sphaerotilus sp. FB-5]